MKQQTEAAINHACRDRIRIDTRPLPGHCACTARVFLVLPYGWRDEDGREHRCAAGSEGGHRWMT